MSIALLRTALLIPVPEAEPVVAPWRARFDPSAAEGVPAHITLIFPFLPASQCDSATLNWLEELFTETSTFDFVLGSIRRFPGILYLAVTPPEPVVSLVGKLVERFPDAPPYGGAYQEFIPHLTIAHSCDEATLGQIEATVQESLPIRCSAREVLFMNEHVDGRWAIQTRYQLAGSRSQTR